MQKTEDITRRCAHLPIIYKKNPSFVRRRDHLPTTLHGKGHKHVHKENVHKEKTKGEEAQVARTLILLLAQQESKTRGRGGKGTHHHSFRNAFIHTYPFLKCIHSHLVIFEIHILNNDTIPATARHEPGRRWDPNRPPTTSQQTRRYPWQSHQT